MKRYTIVINYRGRNTISQVEADSVSEAQHMLLDGYHVDGVGDKARRQLSLDIDDPRWKAKPVMETVNAWRAEYWVNNDYMYVHVIETAPLPDPDEPQEQATFADGFCDEEQFHRISLRIGQLEKQADWKQLKHFCLRICKRFPEEYYPMIKAAMACFYLHEYEEMLTYAQNACDNWHEDPLNIFWLALALYKNGRYDEAIRQSDTIIRDDFRWLAYGKYGYDADYAWQLINDCKAIKGLSLLAQGDPAGRPYLLQYLHRGKEKDSCFRKADIRRRL